MPGGHRRQHVYALAPTHLADDDAIGSHAQRISHERPNGHSAATFEACGTTLQAHHVWARQPKLGCILDRDQSLIVGHE